MTEQELYTLFSSVVSDQSKLPHVHTPIEIRCSNPVELKKYADFCQKMIDDARQLLSVLKVNFSLEIDQAQYQFLLNQCETIIDTHPFNVLQGDTLSVYFQNSAKKSFELQGIDLSFHQICSSVDNAQSMFEIQECLFEKCVIEKACCLDFLNLMQVNQVEPPLKINERMQLKYLKVKQVHENKSANSCKGIELYQDFLKWEKEG